MKEKNGASRKDRLGFSKLDQYKNEIRKLLSHGVVKAAMVRSMAAVGRWFMLGFVGMDQTLSV